MNTTLCSTMYSAVYSVMLTTVCSVIYTLVHSGVLQYKNCSELTTKPVLEWAQKI